MYDLVESGKRIRKLREKKGMTQEQLADMVGVSYKTINAIENGSRGTTVDTLDLLADGLGSTIDYIVKGTVENDEIAILLSGLSSDKQELARRLFKGIVENCSSQIGQHRCFCGSDHLCFCEQ